MNVTTILITHSRRFLRQPTTATITDLQNISQSSPSPATTPIAATASTEAAASVPSVSLDSSLSLTILVLLTAIFFMGLFSFLISRSTTAAHHPSTTAERRGVHPSVLSSLPLAAYSAETAKMDGCSICLSEFCEGESVKLIPLCGHVFHPRCVDTWLSAHVTCPLCRSAQLLKSGNEEATWTSDDVS